jgi:hypothetical protein
MSEVCLGVDMLIPLQGLRFQISKAYIVIAQGKIVYPPPAGLNRTSCAV